MNNHLFSTFAPTIRSLGRDELLAEIEQPKKLLIASDSYRGRSLEIAYAAFDYINPNADVVIVGLTPGRQQMRNALVETQRCLKDGYDEADALRSAKLYASFSGPMRTNLVAMLDCVGLGQALGLSSTASLWARDASRVHFTSALRYPVFVDGKNYSGNPSMISTPLLRSQLMQWFATEMTMFPKAVFVPLGPKVANAIEEVAKHLRLPTDRILSGLPHPSGANAERIAFFLGRKMREAVSSKVEPERLLAARASLNKKIADFCGAPK
ncbi:hypothetical protein JQ615_21520 [Bradyrhizobium jicamae]|uniref:Uracil-DNA glycosylase-like domain-containing protein n=1 Tax=Bradyrhizobium jicamae TaxID=280332 RepID=A0ABS5FME3_9BRAD|nr:hypothetical protein [Bradyrhizobium jicamae]MBR0797973.1 hypothetical protein [Bradyrhizobium jicamae]